jgi:hypothetical protein
MQTQKFNFFMSKDKALVIIAHPSGQLCNRLWLYANFIGNSCEYGYNLANLAFYEYAEHFESLKDDLLCRYPSRSGMSFNARIRKLLCMMVWAPLRVLSAVGITSMSLFAILDIRHYRGAERSFDLRGAEWKSALNKRVVFVKGLEFRDWESLVKYRHEILLFLAPRSEYVNAAKVLAEKARMDSECILCGVHIRLGDYKQHKSGCWFYSFEQYMAKMQEFSDLFGTRKPVRFLVCSNENLPQDAFRGLPVTFGSGQFMEDLMALSQCDYIMGPPSTYSAWASFCGDVPLNLLFDLAPLRDESFISVTERLRRRVDLAAQLGEEIAHTGFLELCR